MIRECPHCSDRTVHVKDILFGNSQCMKCGHVVGVHWLPTAFFSTLIFLVTITTTFMVFVQMGGYIAILWFTLPIGALSYLKARFSPLETKMGSDGVGTPSDA